MITLIKVLTLVLISFLAYDTVNFVLQAQKAELPTQVEIRPKYEATETLPPIIHQDEVHEDDVFLGVGFFVFLTGIAGLVMMYFSRSKTIVTKTDGGVLALRRVPEEPYLTYFYDVDKGYGKDDPRLMKNFSEIQLTLAPHPETPLGAKSSYEKVDEHETSRLLQRTDHKTFELTTDEDGDEDEESDDIIDVHLLSNNTSLSVQNTTKRDTTLTQTESSMLCECNMEQFEERLGAVEHGLKTSSEATKEWSKRIEQAEVDLVNLHRQMYTILSKAEFIAPSSDVFSKNAGSTTPTDFYEPTLYKVPDIIVETKKELEQGDLFRKSLTKLSADDNWNTLMEEELAEKIKELTNNAEQPPLDQSMSTTTTDPSKIKDALMKKNEELKEKTRGIVKAMEEAVKASHMRKSKLGVHSHFVAPYRRIQHADHDNPNAYNLRPKSIFK